MYSNEELNFVWRLSLLELRTVSDVIIMRKFEPWRDIFNAIILRISEGNLLSVANPINFLQQTSRNPHRLKEEEDGLRILYLSDIAAAVFYLLAAFLLTSITLLVENVNLLKANDGEKELRKINNRLLLNTLPWSFILLSVVSIMGYHVMTTKSSKKLIFCKLLDYLYKYETHINNLSSHWPPW